MLRHLLKSPCFLCLVGVVIVAPARADNGAAPKGANTPLQAAQPSAPPRLPVPPAARPPSPSAPQPATDSSAPQLKPGEILLNFQAADIQAVVKAVAQMTNRNFLLDPRVKGQITIISAKPVTSQSAYQIFLSALKAQGFTAVEGIGHTRIVPTTEAKTSAEVTDQPYGGEKIMTHVTVVQHNSATQMIPLLRPLMAPTSQIAAYDPANALIITDYADNIRRLLRIIEKIDQPVSSEVTILALKHASALDLADLVARLSMPGGVPGVPGVAPQAAGDRFTIIPDMRTNSLLVRADNPGRVNQIRSLVEKLDVPATRGGHTRVVYLRNADAVKLAEVLRGLIAGEARSQQTAASAVPALPGVARPAASAAGGARAEASLVQADEATNALIINAPDATYNNLRAVIEKLDVRRTQVYVEAMIVEMSTDRADELGIQWAGGVPAGSGAVGAIQNFPSANPGLLGAIASPTTTLPTAGGLLLG
jgi:general secretion pathway protein D